MNTTYFTYRFLTFLLYISIGLCFDICAQTASTAKFGKNRVQYKPFKWSFHDTKNVNTYYYPGGQKLAKYVAVTANREINKISDLLNYRLDKKLYFLVYNDISDANQTNIGIAEEQQNTGGTRQVLDRKIFVYFNGNYNHLRKQIREGIARVYVDKITTGTTFKEVVQNTITPDLPDWVMKGAIAYIGERWSTDLEDRLRQGILQGKYSTMKKLSSGDPVFFGHAIWYYIEMNYGIGVLKNIFTQIRQGKNISRILQSTINKTTQQLFKEWLQYHYVKFRKEQERRDNISGVEWIKKYKRGHHYYQFKPHPLDSSKIVFVTNELGKYKVFIFDSTRKKPRRIFKGGIRTLTQFTDYSYPLLAWSPRGDKLAIVFEKRDKIWFWEINQKTGDKYKKLIPKFERITDFQYMDDRKIVLSAIRRGQSDIYTYNIPSTATKQITNDVFDDTNPTYIKGKSKEQSGIVFSSNRPDVYLDIKDADWISSGNMDLFYYPMSIKASKLVRLTNTPLDNETKAIGLDSNRLVFLSDENGIRNQYLGILEPYHLSYDSLYILRDTLNNKSKEIITSVYKQDSTIKKAFIIDRIKPIASWKMIHAPLTDLSISIREHGYSIYPKQSTYLFSDNGRTYAIRKKVALEPLKSTLINTVYRDRLQGKKQALNADEILPPLGSAQKAKDTVKAVSATEKDIYFYGPFDFVDTTYFISTERSLDVKKTTNNELSSSVTPLRGKKIKKGEYTFSDNKPYRVKFMIDKVVSQLDNSILITPYQKFNPRSPQYERPNLGGLISLGIKDLMEDHKLRIGLRIPFNFRDFEYFFMYENLKKKIDKRFIVYRKSTRQQYQDKVPFLNIDIPSSVNGVQSDVKTTQVAVSFTFPIDFIRSFRLHTSYRNDLYAFKSLDLFSLNLPNYAENWLALKGEYVHDATIEQYKGTLYGSRFNAYIEAMKEIPTVRREILGTEINLPNINDAYTINWGIDFRHYQKIFKRIIWATRVAYSSSVGTRKLIYFLGGVEEDLFGAFDNSIPISTETGNFAFQAPAPNLRGFSQNTRNGNSYIVVNTEVRMPLFGHFRNTPIRSEFIRNFSLVGFFDIGTAWEGINPFSRTNPLFNTTVGQSPVTVTVSRYENPIIMAPGFGLRSVFSGYALKFDMGWGIRGGKIQRPRAHFSFSVDF